MTAILGFSNRHASILTSDLLISSKKIDTDRILHLPSMNSLKQRVPDNFELIAKDLVQKLYVVGNFMFCWAGTKIYAKAYLNEVRTEFAKSRSLSLKKLRSIFESDPDYTTHLAIIGIIRGDSSSHLVTFGENLSKHHRTDLGKIAFGGSGTKNLAKFINNIPGTEKADPMQYLSYAFTASGFLQQQESITGATLSDYYGGGYEIGSSLKGKFGKNAEATYIFWEITCTDRKITTTYLMPHVLKYFYFRDILVILRFRFNAPGLEFQPISDGETSGIFLIPELQSPPLTGLPENFSLPSLNSSPMCNVIRIHYGNKGTKVAPIIQFNYDDVYFQEIDQTLTLHANSKFLNYLRDLIVNHPWANNGS